FTRGVLARWGRFGEVPLRLVPRLARQSLLPRRAVRPALRPGRRPLLDTLVSVWALNSWEAVRRRGAPALLAPARLGAPLPWHCARRSPGRRVGTRLVVRVHVAHAALSSPLLPAISLPCHAVICPGGYGVPASRASADGPF